jgi:hypothetical protein
MLTAYDVMCGVTLALYFWWGVILIGSKPKKKHKRRRVWIEEED